MKKYLFIIPVLFSLALSAAPAFAASITYTATVSGGTTYATTQAMPIETYTFTAINLSSSTTAALPIGCGTGYVYSSQDPGSFPLQQPGITCIISTTTNSAYISFTPPVAYTATNTIQFSFNGYLNIGDNVVFSYSAPAPAFSPIVPVGSIVVPTSTAPDLLASIGNIFADPGVLAFVIVGASIPLFFFFVWAITGLFPGEIDNKKRKK